MNEVEQWLRKDRVKGIPEPPDLRYTEAVVRRQLGQGAAPAPEPGARYGDWWIAVAAAGLVVAAGFFLASLSAWWLAALPLSVLPLTPILLIKERERS